MMVVPELWREAAKYPAALGWSVTLLILVFATYIVQAIAIASALTAILGSRSSEVWSALGVILGVAVARLILSLLQTAAATRLGGLVRHGIRERALHASLVADRLHDTTVRDGSLQASLGEGIDGTDAYVSKYIPAIAQVLLACPLVIVCLLVLNPWAGLWVGIGVLLALVGGKIWKKVMARRTVDHWDSYESLSADLLESLQFMATLRTLGDVPETRTRLQSRSEALRRATERVMRVSLAETGLTDFAIQAGMVAAASTAIFHASTGEPAAFEVYLILLLSSEAFRPIRDLSKHWHAGFLGLTAVPGLTHLGAFTPAEENLSNARSTDESINPEAQELRVQDLTYRYPGADTPVLSSFNLIATKGTLSALVGPSGAGKSTLFDVLLGFLTPQNGSICLDGRPRRSGDIAVVSQRPILFAGTVRDNLTVTGPRTTPELEAACSAAGVLDEIHAFPQGFDTVVTEAGTSLSGGQRQRLALARALLAHRPVLLVDEPTSALDQTSAARVIDTLHHVAAERIVVMISHRPESLSNVENIIRLDNDHLHRSERS